MATGRRRNEDDESAGKQTAKRGPKMGGAEKSRPALKIARTGAKEYAWLVGFKVMIVGTVVAYSSR